MLTSPKIAGRASDPGRWQTLPAALVLGTLVSFPFAAHYGAASGKWLPALGVLSGLLLMLAFNANGWHRGLLVMGAAAIVAGATFDQGQSAALLVYSQPVLVNLALCYLFGRTLLNRRQPLITRYIGAIRGSLDAPTRRYGRRLTQVWTLLSAALALESVLLAVFAPREIWSLVTGFLNYLLVAAVIVVEYQVRVRVLSHLKHRGFVRFLLSLARCPLSTILKD